MKNLKDTKTADLITEWVWLDEMRPIDRSDPSKYHQQCDAIAAELDRRATEAGIQLHVDGMVSFSKFGDKTDDMVCPRIYAAELHALLGWLLLKEGGKG